MVSYLPEPTEGGNFTPPPAGTHPAICYRFIDLGTQRSNFNGETKHKRMVMLSWEITDPELRTEDGHAFSISQRYTWSMHEKATLRKTLEAWRGVAFTKADFGPDGFNVKKLIDVGCLLSIIHDTKDDGRTFGNIGAIMKLPKGMEAGTLTTPTAFLSLEPDEFDRDVFNALSDKMQETIKASPEYQALVRPAQRNDYAPPQFDGPPPSDPSDPGFGADDIPF